ncbi:DUF6452 family protein [Solitalea lacus]|uniref:DUF6452 family protein n=1 Tax=Solitalea lacus TaxID=2911172 RepID=UPI001EDC0C80|nr:DUF6452 family protein [Solitalea lacus]UKJ05859.1 DUF6452 family protein [Solitalea lacus]
MKHITIYLILAILFSIISCTQDKICSDTTPSPGMVVEFYSDTALPKQPGKRDTFKYFLPDTLTIYGIGAVDSALKKQTNVQKFILPVNFDATASDYVLVMKSKATSTAPSTLKRDTLKAKYELKREFVSQECGFKNVFPNAEITTSKNRIKNYSQLQKDIVNEASTTLRIYFLY